MSISVYLKYLAKMKFSYLSIAKNGLRNESNIRIKVAITSMAINLPST